MHLQLIYLERETWPSSALLEWGRLDSSPKGMERRLDVAGEWRGFKQERS
jgi:hypothetical protein